MGENVPRRMKRLYRQKKGEELPALEPVLEKAGFEAIPSEEELEQEQKEMGKTAWYEGEKHGLEKIQSEEEIEKSLEKKNRAKELAVREVKEFRQKHKRLPMRTEYDQIVENIFYMMQKEEKKSRSMEQDERGKQKETQRQEQEAKRRERRKSRSREDETLQPEILKEEKKPKLGIEDLDVKSILSEDTSGKEETGELEGLAGEEGKEEFSLKELEEKSPETGKCQHCGKESKKQVFCAECGEPFCEKCAKTTKQVGDKTEMQCPNCGAKTKK